METINLVEEVNKVKEIVLRKQDFLFHLKHRWNDEKEYEDFNDYKKIILEIFKDFPDTKIDKNFNITIKGKERKIIVKVRSSEISLEVHE